MRLQADSGCVVKRNRSVRITNAATRDHAVIAYPDEAW